MFKGLHEYRKAFVCANWSTVCIKVTSAHISSLINTEVGVTVSKSESLQQSRFNLPSCTKALQLSEVRRHSSCDFDCLPFCPVCLLLLFQSQQVSWSEIQQEAFTCFSFGLWPLKVLTKVKGWRTDNKATVRAVHTLALKHLF